MASARAEPSRRATRTPLWAPLLPPLVGLLCTAASLTATFTYDDVPMVRDDPRIRNLGNPRDIWLSNWWHVAGGTPDLNARQEPLYRPLTLFTFALNYAVGRLDPRGYHLVNILLHAATCGLVWWLARRLTRDDTAALVAGLLFAVHPVHIEAVASIVGRAEVLAAGLTLAGLFVILPRAAPGGVGRMLAAAPLFLLALLAKESAISYPAVALLALYATRADARPARWWLTRAGLLLVPLLVYFPLRRAALGGHLFRTNAAGEVLNPLTLANGLWEHACGALTVLGWYTRLLVLPDRLSCDYGQAVIDPRAGFGLFALLGLLSVAGLLVALAGWLRGGARWKLIAVLAAMFVASYALISNSFMLIGVAVGERLLYWPSAFALILAAVGLVAFARRAVQSEPSRRRLFAVVGVAFVVALGLRSTVRCLDWRSSLELAARDVATYPQSAHLNAGYAAELISVAEQTSDAEQRAELLDAAARHVRQALRIAPGEVKTLLTQALLHRAQGDPAAASADVETVLHIDPLNPWGQLLRAELSGGQAQVQAQLIELERAASSQPNDAAAHAEYGRALLKAGRSADAAAQLATATRLAPESGAYQRHYGEALAQNGRVEEAIAAFRAALERTPDDWQAQTNLALLLAERDPAAALVHAARARALAPENLQVVINYAEALVLNGRDGEALQLYRQILASVEANDPYRDVVAQRVKTLERGR